MNPNGIVTGLMAVLIGVSLQRDPCNGKLAYFDRYVDYDKMKNLKGTLAIFV